MCNNCLERADAIRKITDAIDDNREAFWEIIRTILADTQGQLFQIVGSVPNEAPSDVQRRAERLTEVLMANYLITFLTAEMPMPETMGMLLAEVHNKAVGDALAYAKARKLRAN